MADKERLMMVLEARDGSGEIIVVVPGFVVSRKNGVWVDDIPSMTFEDLATDFAPVDSARASALEKEARTALMS